MPKKITTLLLFIIAITTTSIAQPFNLDKKIKPVELKLFKFQPKNQPKGRLNVTKAYQVNDTAYYYCKGLSIYGITEITVASKSQGSLVSVTLHKDSWKKVSKNIPLNKNRLYESSFKTEGSFGLRIVSKKAPAVYNIYVWASDDVKVKLPTAFKSK